jgi:uncharacterized spore protein YtfJ
MQSIESLFDKSVAEIERMLNSKTVVGEPMTIGGNTLIPLINVGFGFGVGTGKGSEPEKGAGEGGGTGGGGGVKPVALVIVNEDGVRVEPIKSGTASVLEKVVEAVGKAANGNGEPGNE